MSASFDAYKVFYYVGKFNNITHAANALFLSQSTVSRSIQSLESDLGCKLFERFQHGVTLTAEGEMLYSHVARACEDILIGEEKLKQLQSGEIYKIRLGVDNFVFTQFILPVMKDFQRDFPDVHIEFSGEMITSPDHCFQSLLCGDCDAVFTLGPVPEAPGIVTQYLGEYQDVFIAGRRFEELNRDRVRIYDVSLCPFASLNRGISGSEYLRNAFASYGLRVEPCYQVEDFRHLLDIVDMGMCLAIVPSPLFARLNDYKNIFPIKVSTTLPKRNICIVTSKNNPHNLARDELIKRIRKNMQSDLV
ncbi:MAG: LysR family transcriptional regulator [Oscillospiraceae bacterium]|nr:LysR family transcriptional regulator [Oscillospiraceae bacterium]